MAFRRVVIQPTIRIGAATTQEVRFATQVTGWKTAVFWVNLFQNASTVAANIDIRGASSLSLNDDASSANVFWPSILASPIALPTQPTTGVYKSAAVTNLPDYVRWLITGTNNTQSFEIIAYLWDV